MFGSKVGKKTLFFYLPGFLRKRLKKRNQDLTSSNIKNLQKAIAQKIRLTCNYSLIRRNFVLSNKGFKTTIFGQNQNEIKKVLKNLLEIVEESFDSNLLSNNFLFTQQKLKCIQLNNL